MIMNYWRDLFFFLRFYFYYSKNVQSVLSLCSKKNCTDRYPLWHKISRCLTTLLTKSSRVVNEPEVNRCTRTSLSSICILFLNISIVLHIAPQIFIFIFYYIYIYNFYILILLLFITLHILWFLLKYQTLLYRYALLD